MEIINKIAKTIGENGKTFKDGKYEYVKQLNLFIKKNERSNKFYKSTKC